MSGNEKMSKSLNNFTSLTDLTEKTDPRAYRLLVLRSHYRSPLDVTPETIDDAERALLRLDTFARRFSLPALAGKSLLRASDVNWSVDGRDLYERAGALLDEDLDTPSAVALLFEAISSANSLADEGKDAEAAGLAAAVNALFGSLGLTLVASGGTGVDENTAALVQARDDARTAKNWAEADRIRDELVAAGWVVEDASGTTHVRRN
jgi:cysteinyl-tRNA synthetase